MTQPAVTKTPVKSPLPAGARTAEVAFLLLLPIAAFFAIHFETVNQTGMLDPYIYTGYVHNFDDLIARYGIRYYVVRFGFILPAQAMVGLFGPIAGYLVLRYLMALTFGLPLYAVCKRYTSGPVAVCIYTVAMTSPYIARMLLWDHPDATGGPFLSAAICLLLLSQGRAAGFSLLAGLCLGMAGNSNIFTLAIFGVFLAVYAGLWLVHRRPVRQLVQRVGIAAGGALAVCAAGCFYYHHRTGYWDIFTLTLYFSVGLSRGGMARWHLPGFAWTLTFIQVFIPVWISICCVACLSFWRRSFPLAVMGCYGIAVTAFYYVHQFLLGADTLQLFYYFSYAAPAIFLMLAVVLQRLWVSAPLRPVWFVSCAVASTSVVWMTVSFASPHAIAVVRQNRAAVFLTVASAALAIWLSILLRKKAGTVGVLATVVMFGLTLDAGCIFYAVAVHLRRDPTHMEMDLYQATMQLARRMPKMRDSGVMMFWYKSAAQNISSIQCAYLWTYSRVSPPGDDPGMPTLTPEAMAQLKETQSVVLLAETAGEIRTGLDSLTSRGVRHREIRSDILAAGDYKVYWTLVDLRSQ
jgi:hypothetical protein